MRRNEPKKIIKNHLKEFAGLGCSKVGWGGQTKAMEVKHKGSGVGTSRVERVAEVHKEGASAPTEFILNEGVGELGLVEEVCGCDSDGVSQPSRVLGCLAGSLCTCRATRHRKAAVSAAVMYWKQDGWPGTGRIPRGRPGILWRRKAHRTMRKAIATGQRPGLEASQKKGIFSPFCLFFCIHQQMRTGVMGVERELQMSVTGFSPSQKNLKSSAMKASGSCNGHAAMRLKFDFAV